MPPILPITDDSIDRAAAALRSGALVAFPTETVYGLGADATDDRAVAKIFEAKDRPRFNPLIVHFPDTERVREFAALPPPADRLAERFWPGAISFVLPRVTGTALSRLVSAGLPTVAVRVPAQDDARRLLRATDRPVAAPSANRSGRISPTKADHVAEDLGDRVSLILDGGPCSVGVESTVLDLSGGTPTILRPGGVASEDITAALHRQVAFATSDDEAPRSPGMLSSHYAPELPVRMNAASAEPGEAYLGFGPTPTADLNLSATGDLTEAAANLFAHLHDLDSGKRWRGIAAAPVPDKGLGRAINDRLRRAAAPRD